MSGTRVEVEICFAAKCGSLKGQRLFDKVANFIFLSFLRQCLVAGTNAQSFLSEVAWRHFLP